MDTLIIGGGVVGLSVANELQERGHQVTLLEQSPGVGAGCSFANAGWVTPCFALPLPQPGMFFKSIQWLLDQRSPLHIQPRPSWTLLQWLLHFMRAMNAKQLERSTTVLTEISKSSLRFYKELARRTDIGFEQKGLLMVSATAEGLKTAKMEMDLMSARGIPGRWLEGDELLNFEPLLKPLVKGGVYFPEEAHLEPQRVTQALAAEAVSKGAKIVTGAEVYDFEVTGRRIGAVITTRGAFRADLVILAAGTWSRPMAQRLGLKIPVLGGKGYSMVVRDSRRRPQHPIMIVERKIAVTPRADSFRLAGTLELVNQDFSISPNRVNAIWTGAREYLAFESNAGPMELWRGLRPCTPDGVPLIGFSRKMTNLFYCTGHQMLGVQSAPGSARLAADLIENRAPTVDPEPFRPERF